MRISRKDWQFGTAVAAVLMAATAVGLYIATGNKHLAGAFIVSSWLAIFTSLVLGAGRR